MDTKLKNNKVSDVKYKNNKNFNIINSIVIAIMLFSGIVMVSLYPKIQEVAGNKSTSYCENEYFLERLYKNTCVLYRNVVEAKQGKKIEPSDIYLKPKSEVINNDGYDKSKNKFNESIKGWEEQFQDSYQNLDYLIKDKDGNVIKSNSQNNLKQLTDSDDISTINSNYSFFITMSFDENGQINLSNICGGNENAIINALSRYNMKYLMYRYDNFNVDYVIDNPIKNMTFIYGINKNLKYSDNVSEQIEITQMRQFGNISYVYVLILSAIIVILSLSIPFRFENEVILFKRYLKVKFEVLFILVSIVISFMFRASNKFIFYTNSNEYVDNLLIPIGFTPSVATILVVLFNIIYWMIFVLMIFFSVVVIKDIFSTGFIKYFKERTLVGSLLRFLKRNIKKTIKSFEEINLSEKSNKVLIKFVAINFVIVAILCLMWVFGLFVAIIYSIILFFLLKKYYNSVSYKFTTLLDETHRIAEGNLNAFIIDEDLGLFNPLKEEILKIQNGFKKAVEEEVKSQRMKTELISNVSHDLKTPLTSIITYVDLLKSENLTEEDRKSYVDTLDKKSQRLKYLIEDLFEVSKATSGNISLNIVKVDVVELMKQTQIELEDKINGANLIIRNNFPSEKVVLDLDSQKTFRIFENLLINVVKYAMKGSRVYVDILKREDGVEITIKNMSAEEINFNSNYIVERFQRGDKSRNTEGSGLGLAIVKSFVEVQGGKFDLEIDGDLFKVIILFEKI